MKKIDPTELVIAGKWISVAGKIVADGVCQRIAELVANHLEVIGHDKSGWGTLYRDPSDGRFWELIYPHSELHGGGAPQLHCVTQEEAERKYQTYTN